MHILVINSGSSSIKYQLYETRDWKVLMKGIVEKIGQSQYKDHNKALTYIFQQLKAYQIDAIGHRVVHGGEKINKPTIITPKIIQVIKEHIKLAALHNPANLAGILACQKLLPKVPQVAVFDTAFHQSMTKEKFLYPLPLSFYQKYKIRKYGFHGISHQYIYEQYCKITKKKQANIISCHIGNGASITAIQAGKVLKTSMGFTPLEGLMMGTRCGSIDPSILIFLLENGWTAKRLDDILNKESGLKAIAGSGDMRDIITGYKKKNPKAILAIEMYLNRIVKYIGACFMLLKHIDAIVLTAGVMENGILIRHLLLKKLSALGIKEDVNINKTCIATEKCITTKASKIPVWVIPTNEEVMIAKETARLV